MAQIRTPRRAWIDAGLRALSVGGPDAVRIEALAADLGVSKGGFYGQFTGRPDLLNQMLDTWENSVVDRVIARVESQPQDPRARLQHLFELAAGRGVSSVELALRDWARRERDIAARLRRVDNRRMRYLRRLFEPICTDEADVEARSLLAFSLFVGTNLIAAHHPGTTRAHVLQLAVDRLLERPPTRLNEHPARLADSFTEGP